MEIYKLSNSVKSLGGSEFTAKNESSFTVEHGVHAGQASNLILMSYSFSRWMLKDSMKK